MKNFYSCFLLFSSVFSFFNVNVEASIALSHLKPVSDFISALLSNVNTVQLPVKYPLPPLGLTACSTYKHADLDMKQFQRLCYTQKWVFPDANFPYKCMTLKFTVGIPLANVPFEIPTPLDFTPQAGYSVVDFVSKTNKSQHLLYNTTFVEYQKAAPLYYVTNGVNLTLLRDSVITHYTDEGYVHVVCPLNDLKKPVCNTPQYVVVCTYARFPPDSDVEALVDPLNAYPYYMGKNLVPMNQTEC